MLSVKFLAKHGGRRAHQIRNQTIGSAARLYSVTAQTSPYHNRLLGVAQQTQSFRDGLRAASLLSGRTSRIHARLMSVETEVLDSLGDSITTAVLVHWEKEPGDSVKEDDVIAVVETDKVTMDIRAKKSGVFTEALVDLQAEIAVGSPLYKLDTAVTEAPINSEATPPPARAPPSSAPEVAAEETETVPVPVMGESITSGAVSEWTCKTGDSVAADQVVATIETDKVNVEVRSPKAGVIVKTFAEEGDEVNVGEPLFELQPGAVEKPAESAPASSESSSPPPSKSKSTPAPPAKTELKAPPASSSSSSSSSSGGGAKQADPAAAGKKGKGAAATLGSLDPHAAPAKGVANRGETRVKMTRMRQRIAQRLKDSQNTAAMLTTFQEVDMSNLIELRKRHKDEFEKAHGVKLGFMSAFVRACTTALQETPAVNAVIDDNTQEIVYREYVDISVAVASPSGLVVPVLRNTENMNFAEVEKAIAEYGKKAKEGRLALEEMAGGTFTISNGGVFGSLYGMPIINPPQSAILGMHATKMRPVCLPDGSIVARPMMYLALTYDHRMIDGREAVTFLKSVANKIEDPHRLLLAL